MIIESLHQAENMPCSGTTSDECQGNACQWNAATNRCSFGTFSMASAQAALRLVLTQAK